MGILESSSVQLPERDHHTKAPPPEPKLDAGAQFVLKSKGSWIHCGYHLTTSIVAPPLLSLPFAMASLGWSAGVISLAIAAVVTFYSYHLLSRVLEHNAQQGRRHLRFGDMAFHILGLIPRNDIAHEGFCARIAGKRQNDRFTPVLNTGAVFNMRAKRSFYPHSCARIFMRYIIFALFLLQRPKWAMYYVGPIQFLVCYGTVVGCTLLGGQCMKSISLLWNPYGEMKLYQFIVIFGGLLLILAQMPSFHSLRNINLLSLILCLAYSACAAAGAIDIGNSSIAPPRDYSLDTNGPNRLFGIFNALAIIATAYGNGIIPEIQATLAPPVTGKMFKGLCVCYAVVAATFFSVAISGYWAFGNHAKSFILTNFIDNAKPLLPKWFVFMSNAFVILQLSAVGVVYLQPTNEILERTFADPKSGEFSARNVVPRLISRSLAVLMATAIAAMLPFFGDLAALIGAFGFMPLDFILPVVFFNLTFKPSKKSLIFWVNTTIAVVFSAFAAIAAVAAVRQIILDAKTYRLFADV